VERFREEVEHLGAALGLDQFYLYEHSWGGMLAIECALKYQRHLKALVISNGYQMTGENTARISIAATNE
jgi:proline iminopeptidase